MGRVFPLQLTGFSTCACGHLCGHTNRPRPGSNYNWPSLPLKQASVDGEYTRGTTAWEPIPAMGAMAEAVQLTVSANPCSCGYWLLTHCTVISARACRGEASQARIALALSLVDEVWMGEPCSSW
jgi:hypothetical protein